MPSTAISTEEIRLVLAWSRAFAAETAQINTQHEHDIVVMYELFRSWQPDLYVELGRGQGCSTLNAGMAFAANGGGSIVSFDIHMLDRHDLLDRLQRLARVDLRCMVEDIRNLDTTAWERLIAGRKRVAVLIDAHEETGAPITETLLPLVAAHPEIGWLLMFHDVQHVEDRVLFDAFDHSYTKVYPYLSRFPEYAAILPAVVPMEPTHFARLGAKLDEMMRAAGVATTMPEGRSQRHAFAPGHDPDDIEIRFRRRRPSSMMALMRSSSG